MKKQKLTDQEQRVWEFVLEFLGTYKITPMRTEIAEKLGISSQLVQYRLKSLEEKGWVILIPRKKRNICIK